MNWSLPPHPTLVTCTVDVKALKVVVQLTDKLHVNLVNDIKFGSLMRCL